MQERYVKFYWRDYRNLDTGEGDGTKNSYTPRRVCANGVQKVRVWLGAGEGDYGEDNRRGIMRGTVAGRQNIGCSSGRGTFGETRPYWVCERLVLVYMMGL